MSFNPNLNMHQSNSGQLKKAKRVSDMNAIGPTVPAQNSFMPMHNVQSYPSASAPPSQPPIYGAPEMNMNVPQYNYNTNYGNQNEFVNYGNYNPSAMNMGAVQPNMPPPQYMERENPQTPSFNVFQQPIVQDMAMEYGQKLADQGRELVNEKIERYIPVTRLKYYFAVDNKYVMHKLRLIFFPFTHSDWSLKYNEDNPVQPRYDINAPDLYIPAMAYITYIVLAGFVLGLQNRFSPEKLGMQGSSALAYSVFELLIYAVTLYIANIETKLKTLDLLAFSGYKYSNMVACILVSILFKKTGYYLTLIYCGLCIFFFMLRTLKAKFVEVAGQNANTVEYNNYTDYNQQSVGRKRKLYFLFLVAGAQPLLTFWLTMHLIPGQ